MSHFGLGFLKAGISTAPGGGSILGLGNNLGIYRSLDGLTASPTIGSNRLWTDAAYAPLHNRWLAVNRTLGGNSMLALSTDDGATWSDIALPVPEGPDIGQYNTNNEVWGVCYVPEWQRWFAIVASNVAEAGGGSTLHSLIINPANTNDIQVFGNGSNYIYRCVAYCNANLIIAVRDAVHFAIAQSVYTVNPTTVTPGTFNPAHSASLVERTAQPGGWMDIAWSQSLQIAVCVGHNHINNTTGVSMYSNADATAWTANNFDTGRLWTSIAWSPTLNMFVAVAKGGTNPAARSSNGVNWTISAAPSVEWHRVRWSTVAGMFIAWGTNSVMTSDDAVNWTSQTPGWPSVDYLTGATKG